MPAVLFALSLVTWLQGPAPAEASSLPPAGPAANSAQPAGEPGAETAAPATTHADSATPAASPGSAASAPTEAAPGSGAYTAGVTPATSSSPGDRYGVGLDAPAPRGDSAASHPYLVGGGVDAPTPTATPAVPPPRKLERFVLTIFTGLTFGISPSPSLEGTMFFGGRLRETWALGYSGTVSLGLADRYVLGVIAHRHHITALHNFSKRGFASVGAGLGVFYFEPALVEAEGRVGARLGQYRRFILGGVVRLGYNFHFKERAPMPQFGVFLGAAFF